MKFSFSKEFTNNSITTIDNAFINNYFFEADATAVKVYLYGLYLCNNKHIEVSLNEFAENLKITTFEVEDHFKYWEEFGLVTILETNPLNIVYFSPRVGNKLRRVNSEKYSKFSSALQALITSRMISTNEFNEYFMIMDEYGIKQEAMLMIVKYCIDLKGNDISYHYISKVAKNFGLKGITTPEKVDNELQEYNIRTSEIAQVLTALNSKRKPEMEDLNFLNKWTNELNFELDSILFAAKKLKKTSIVKLDEFLTELYNRKCFDKTEIKTFIESKQKVIDTAIKINQALSIYVPVLDTEIDTYISKWISYGYDEGTLVYIANRCFKKGKNNLEKMDEVIDVLYKNGLITLESVTNYIVEENKKEKLIKQILDNLGLSRNPTNWDKQNLAQWEGWNFNDDMIIEASKISSGKNNPIAYMNAILSNWKNKGIFNIKDIENNDKVISKNINADIEKQIQDKYLALKNKAEATANANLERALKNEEFAKIYYRLNSIERDIAIAEIDNNEDKLLEIENEKVDLLNAQNVILADMDLTLKDLSPKYHCSKCNDTGKFNGERCSCYYEHLAEIVE